MNLPLITIITITKDDPAGLARTLASTAAWRTGLGVEHLVVASGEAPACVPADVTLLRQPAHGIAAAFNEGLRSARGEWVWFLNGGDAIHAGLSPVWLQTLLEHTDSDMVIGTIQEDAQPQPRRLPPMRDQWPMLDSWPPHPAVVARRAALVQAGGFSEGYRTCMDFDLWQRLLGAGARTDTVGMPFASFDGRGLTSRPENLGLLFRENGAVLWRHQGKVWRALGRGPAGLTVRWLRAVRHLFS